MRPADFDPTRAVLIIAATLTLAAPAAAQSYLADVGYTDLQARLGTATPTGAGVWVMQVEAAVSTNPLTYAPDQTIANRPGFTIAYRTSPLPPPYSGHANSVGNLFYGDASMATGVTQVDAWEANDWINRFLGVSTGQLPTVTNIPKVSNHSYVGDAGTSNDDLLRRADYLVDRGEHIMVVAVGANAGTSGTTPPAAIFGSGYNSISVGRSDGLHSSGLTTVATDGRVKPDLVAPAGTTSEATPIVAAAATVLVQAAGADALAARPQTIKAMLMAGATKDEPEFAASGGWDRTPTRPLDPVFGAGEVNVDNAHRILTAGRQPANPAATVARTGWDYDSVNSATGATSRRYFFDVPAGDMTTSLSAVLAWDREFAAGTLVPTLADLNLSLYLADASFNLVGTPLDSSVSIVDNVEHIWMTTSLEAGRYAFVADLNGVGTSNYALAWQVRTSPVPEPGLALLAAALGAMGCRLLSPRTGRSAG